MATTFHVVTDPFGDLPPIGDMINIVRMYIWKVKGAMVNIQINMADESRELTRLEWAYRVANEYLIKEQFKGE